MTPGAPISVEGRGDGTERLRLHARERVWLRECRSGWSLLRKLSGPGQDRQAGWLARRVSQVSQLCRWARSSEGHEFAVIARAASVSTSSSPVSAVEVLTLCRTDFPTGSADPCSGCGPGATAKDRTRRSFNFWVLR